MTNSWFLWQLIKQTTGQMTCLSISMSFGSTATVDLLFTDLDPCLNPIMTSRRMVIYGNKVSKSENKAIILKIIIFPIILAHLQTHRMSKLYSSCVNMPICILFCFFLFLSRAYSQSQLYDQEHAVLLKIKEYLQDPPFLSHWTPSNSSHCSWPEITCSSGSVTGLSFKNTNINKTIPPFLCDLQNLTHIDFQLNFIPGEFPTSLYNCSKLDYLDLSQNNFIGKIPADIDRLFNLRVLILGANNFSGDIPATIGRLNQLTNLQLHQCLFNGTIPAEIGNLSNLEFLFIAFNSKLPPSKLPFSFARLKNLKYFYMHNTNLMGEIPETIGELVALEELNLSGNDLTGDIPSSLLTLKNLRKLHLFKNRLSGEIPRVIEALCITDFDISENNLTGKIPNGIGNLEKLSVLNLFMNQLSGEIPESLGRLPALKDFSLFLNNLSGTLPQDFGRYSKLETFEISSNRLEGRLPENLCYYGKFYKLIAYDNNLSGELPESLGKCGSLYSLRISNNEFSGNIPSGLWTSLNLSTLMLDENKFTGKLPERLSQNVSRFSISYNQFSGRIPAGVSSWNNVVVFNASKNLFTGSIPRELTNLPRLTTLLLDQNQLTGPLPSDVVSWKSLRTLNLSQNQLSGEIPDEIVSLPDLTMLDLSENQLSGQIPTQLARLTLTNLNLSSNGLTGRVPNKFENPVYAGSFLNNPQLCADTRELNLTFCNSVPQRSSKGSSVPLALILSLVTLAALAASLFSFWIVRIHRRKKQDSRPTWELTAFQRLTFTESEIVSGLTQQNIIGRGGCGTIYRVAINQNDYVAVKKISDNQMLGRKLENAFLAEVKILSNIRHNNIVKLLCCISGENSLLLVYEYLENRSLDQWLDNKSKSSAMSSAAHHVILDWPMRLQIAIGAAQGLNYLHHDCLPPVIHRDVKTSNILLDSEFMAKIADFGLAKMLIKPEELATMSTVAGSFGYIAPEYAQSMQVSEKIDVYSFGVILLELTTGRKANYGDEHSSLVEWAWRQIQVGSSVEDALDKEIKAPYYLDEMCSVFKLGLMCTSPLPSRRPSMKEVLQILVQCSNPHAFAEKNVTSHHDAVPLLTNSESEHRMDVDDDS